MIPGVKRIAFTSAAARQWRKLTAATRGQIDLKLTRLRKPALAT
jgi:hypothetical protein